MLFEQKQRFESYLRVQDFLAQNRLPQPPANFAVQKKVLDDAVVGMGSHTGDQTGGRKESRADTVRQRALRRVERDEHLAPISKIGRALLPKDPGLQKALQLPGWNIATLHLVTMLHDELVDVQAFEIAGQERVDCEIVENAVDRDHFELEIELDDLFNRHRESSLLVELIQELLSATPQVVVRKPRRAKHHRSRLANGLDQLIELLLR
jgi:hypothetical protein